MPSSTRLEASAASAASASSLLGPDNRCCFCLTLRIGAAIVALANAFVNVATFTWYSTSPTMDSGWTSGSSSRSSSVNDLDICVFSVFVLQLTVDALLVTAAVKRRPALVLPWLCANAVLMAILVVLVALLLLVGYVQVHLDYDEYVWLLSLLGCLAAAHTFSCIVVFQFRRNLVEEQRMAEADGGAGLRGRHADYEANAQPSAPSAMLVRAPSPPPTYEEASKGSRADTDRKGDRDDMPPAYFEAATPDNKQRASLNGDSHNNTSAS